MNKIRKILSVLEALAKNPITGFISFILFTSIILGLILWNIFDGLVLAGIL